MGVLKDDKWGYIDKTGEIVLPFLYEDSAVIDEKAERFVFLLNGKWGILQIVRQ